MPNTITLHLKKSHLHLALAVVIALCLALALFNVRAAFVEPGFAPGDSDQDFAQNILGANNANNDFDSSLVSSAPDGSLIERLEYIQANYVNGFDYSRQKNQIWDDWKGSASSTAGTLAYAYANSADQNHEESVWASSTDTSLGGANVASGIVKRDSRTGLYWSDCYAASSGSGTCSTRTNSFTLNGVIADTDDGLDAEGGQAVDFCEALSLDANGDGVDETDWYLPSQKELMQAYINGAASNIPRPDYGYWSSTEGYNGSGYAWSVGLNGGYTVNPGKTDSSYARCARR